MSDEAELISITCGLCGEELTTSALSTEVEICKCGTTALDEGTVRLMFQVGEKP